MSFSSCSRMWQCQTYWGLLTPSGLDLAFVGEFEPGADSGYLGRVRLDVFLRPFSLGAAGTAGPV